MTLVMRHGVPVGTVAAGALLAVAAPAPAAALRVLERPSASADLTAPLVALLSLAAWGLTSWLALSVALTAGAHLPGLAGRACAGVSRRVIPVTVRRAVEVALGFTVAVGTIGATPAAASPAAPGAGPAAPAAAGLDWGARTQAAQPPPDLDWAAKPAAPAAPGGTAVSAAAPGARDVLVRPGDSLWQLAAQDLSARTGTAPTDAQVAQAWPSWWAANRDAVGDDPHLIHPGTHLTPPASFSPTS